MGHRSPSAKVYRSVIWDDPKDGKGYEHDVVAVLGNQIFMFEAKSGKIKEPARRGGIPSLKSTLKELFVEPAEQSQRLQEYLNEYGKTAQLSQKGSKEPVDIDLTKPKAVYRFGVTIEGLASLTAGRRYFESLGLIAGSSPWAPSLSIGELLMIVKHLDSEVSFGHYLSRRYSIESLLDFVGDEQDLLSMYLTNGFCVLGDDTRQNTLILVDADDMVRTPKTPVDDRRNCDISGVQLAPRWKSIVREVYAGHPKIDRHKFDIIFAILNMPPPMLMHLQRRIGRWKTGGGGSSKSGEHAKYAVGDRQFVVLLNYMDKQQLRTTHDITGWCRTMAMSVADDFEGTTDCVVVTLYKHSSTRTYDGISFFRVKPSSSGRLGATF
ncbi:NERD domain protein [Sulfitobacter donghicola DSW-25 = KCTC 12864 = JCM 14565]|nr:NERD domain protein [Sulfitobacter donghicola DSW-25 = KCTC 12864 = JCM 14565]